MPDWKRWRDMADESIKAARDLQESCPRSAVSRSYYGAYQAATAFLLYRKQVPPDTREAWSHIETPNMLAVHLVEVGVRRGVANNTTQKLKLLYKRRVDADYTSSFEITQTSAQDACKNAGYLINVVGDQLSER